MFAKWLAAAMTVLAGVPCAEAHGIAGNRYFPGTLTFDDPAVADELILPNFSSLAHANGNGNVVDNIFAGAFTRLLTDKLAVSVDSSWVQRNRTSLPQQAGFGLTSLSLKGQVFEDDPHEALVAASISWGIGRLGNKAVAPGDRARSSRAFSSARVWAISRTGWRGCGRLALRGPLQPNSRSVARRQ
jgi:hypothetical protein